MRLCRPRGNKRRSGWSRLDAWVDWGDDGTFGAGDQVFNAKPISPGSNLVQFVGLLGGAGSVEQVIGIASRSEGA